MPDDIRSAGGLSDVVSYDPEGDLEAARQTMKDEIDKKIARLDEKKKAKQQEADEDEDFGELLTDDERALAAEYHAMAAAIDKAVQERKEEKAEREAAAAVDSPPVEEAHPIEELFTEDTAEIVDKLKAKGANEGFDYRTTDDGKRVLLKCYYICPACGTKSKRYVFKDQRTTSCHECKKRMTIRPSVKDEPFPTIDRFNNIYVAGEFLRAGETMDDLEKELKRI